MAKFIAGNQLQLLENGTDFFPALEQAIATAQHEIYLQTYIYAQDVVGVRIAQALSAAASRGVKVYVLLDGFGCKDLDKAFVENLKQSGVEILFYRPKISPWTLRKNRLRRLHRKVSVIDGQVAFVGGINIIDDHNVPHQKPPRIDYAVRIEGAILPEIHDSVRRLWRHIAWMHLRAATGRQFRPSLKSIENGVQVAYVMRDNVLRRRDIENAYLQAISEAQQEILIACAYFVPGRKFRRALVQAAQRGVRVRLLLQGHMEYFLMFATYAFYQAFLRQGIEIYEYKKSFMHSKVAVIDGKWATVGSSNIDPLSLLLAREANVVVLDTGFAAQLRNSIEKSIATGAEQVLLQHWKKANLLKRSVSWVAYGLVRGLTGLVSRKF